jgi:hypothetical protein
VIDPPPRCAPSSRISRGALVLPLLALAGGACGGGGDRTNMANVVRPGDAVTIAYRAERGVAIARITPTGVQPIAQVEDGDELGWLDERTLVVYDNLLGNEHATVRRIVDGAVAETIELSKADLGDTIYDHLELVKRDEVWISRCTRKSEMSECLEVEHLRVVPAPRIRTKQQVVDRPTDRVVHTYDDDPTWPLPPTTVGPPGVTIRKLSLAGEAHPITGAECTKAGQRVTFPEAADFQIGGFETHAVRWVQRTPPIYEVFAVFTDPGSLEHDRHYFFRPCERTELDGYAWLGGQLWAWYRKADDSAKGTWTFQIGERVLGTLHGYDVLRPSFAVPPR